MNDANHIAQDDLYLFALQLLPETEMQADSLHLKECALCRSQLGEIQGGLAVYAMTAQMQTPPPETRDRLLHQVAQEKKIIPAAPAKIVPAVPARQQTEPVLHTPEPVLHTQEPVLYPRNSRMYQREAPEERERGRVAPFLAWAGWTVAVVVAVAAGLQYEQMQMVKQDLATQTAQLNQTIAQTAPAMKLMETLKDANAMQVLLHVPLTVGALPKLDPEAHATYVPETGALVFVASHLDPLLPGKTYELWLLPAQAGQSPIPSGLFKPDANGNATVVLPKLPKGVAAKGFGVTVENDGGSMAPTAPIVLAGM